MLQFNKSSSAPGVLAAAEAEVQRLVRSTGSAPKKRWDHCMPTDDKDILRLALLRDQNYLCAYCGRRIEDDSSSIEHWLPRSADPSLTFDWDNLIAVCKGDHCPNDGDTPCCDKARTKYAAATATRPAKGLLVHKPHHLPSTHEYLFEVEFNSKRSKRKASAKVDGRLVPQSSPACPLHIGGCSCAELDLAELNLNAHQLVIARTRVLDQLRSALNEAGPRAPEMIAQRLAAIRRMGARPVPLWFVEAQYLRKKAKQHGLPLSTP